MQDVEHYVTKVRRLCAEAGIEVVDAAAVAPELVVPDYLKNPVVKHEDACAFWFASTNGAEAFSMLGARVRPERDLFGECWGMYRPMGWRGLLVNLDLLEPVGVRALGYAVPYADLDLLVVALKREIEAQRAEAAQTSRLKQIALAILTFVMLTGALALVAGGLVADNRGDDVATVWAFVLAFVLVAAAPILEDDSETSQTSEPPSEVLA